MVKLYFHSPNGTEPLKSIQSLAEWHYVNLPQGVFGVVLVPPNADADAVEDILVNNGVIVLPPVRGANPIPDSVSMALSKYGVTKADNTEQCAHAMFKKFGMPHLRPTRHH